MKTLLFLSTFISSLVLAGYQKPELLARYTGVDSWNAEAALFCFASEPLVTHEATYLGCQNESGHVLAKWSPGFELVAQARDGGLFSRPVALGEKASWYEFNELGVDRFFESEDDLVTVTDLQNLGPRYSGSDSFLPTMNHSWVFRSFSDVKELWIWKDQSSQRFFPFDVAHIFPPVTDLEGRVVIKVREGSLNESAPDRLWMWTGEKWKLLLEDRDANPASRIISFNHQLGVDQGRVVLVAKTEEGTSLYLLSDGNLEEIAREGRDLSRFDYFNPKIRGEVIVFRGMDLNQKKAFWYYQQGQMAKLLTQGDTVRTDRGTARVDYPSQDALFYGAPGIGPDGSILLQATLTDFDSPSTLIGIGLLKFSKE